MVSLIDFLSDSNVNQKGVRIIFNSLKYLLYVVLSFWLAGQLGYIYSGEQLTFEKILLFISTGQIMLPVIILTMTYIIIHFYLYAITNILGLWGHSKVKSNPEKINSLFFELSIFNNDGTKGQNYEEYILKDLNDSIQFKTSKEFVLISSIIILFYFVFIFKKYFSIKIDVFIIIGMLSYFFSILNSFISIFTLAFKYNFYLEELNKIEVNHAGERL